MQTKYNAGIYISWSKLHSYSLSDLYIGDVAHCKGVAGLRQWKYDIGKVHCMSVLKWHLVIRWGYRGRRGWCYCKLIGASHAL